MSKPKLLLADDSLTIQKVVNLTFADEGIDVITVGDGDSAIREIAQAPPDIVLADVHMPGPSGYEICSMMRAIDETAKIPVMLLVGSFEKFDPGEAERVGANGYVTKPFQSIREFVDQVKGLIAAPEPEVFEEGSQGSEEPSSPVSEVVDTTDIDVLYEQSFAETVEMPPEMAAQMAAAAYASDRLDDSMIETSYMAEQEPESVDFSENVQETYDFEPAGEPDVISLDESQEPEVLAPPDESAPSDESPAPAEFTTAPEMHTNPTEEFSHEARDPFASTAQEFDLDGPDILDLPPMGAPPVTSTPPPEPAQASEPVQSPQVVTLAPEQLDIIVQKVVEKLSEKF